ncbi:catalase [Glaciimonas sp. PAMC28666]|uniref:catalase n=1 Tax=Glaciimonas sp. PAMC28666 TaxID=2807626 RepID=UPI0019626DC3|nr:catalase [Glaciimonas sp. PAMC28666]QRX83378.1 catalase [Glaciimonas sp. PAMC28666]
MVTRKKNPSSTDGAGSVLSTIAGPSNAAPPTSVGTTESAPNKLLEKVVTSQALAAQMPHNDSKPGEYGTGESEAPAPQVGSTGQPASELATASTASENNASPKIGDGQPDIGGNPTSGPLDRVRVDAGGQALTTNQGVAVADNQSSLKIGLRGPAALEDFILREKITHFDHERIPERVVHARGTAAHGYFESYKDLSDLTRAAPFAQAGKRTPVFARFSTVAGERGSADTARDVRGFAVKFYTDEGNWDLVGNNIPVFFIQDAMKFPDLIHAVKPEAHNGIPQASSAHDTFWDFVSLMPESTHMLMWVMSDRAIPRSLRMMQGFGVHTFRLVNTAGESVFCKFHWEPIAGTHSLVWDEAVKIAGADADFHRRDLWEAIEAGAYPEWELGLQIFSEAQAEQFGFDVLDPTKLVPEELVAVIPVGKMTLNRNPDNFFAETEQVAFCTAHVVPGIDFTNDPLLQGRIHSYIDTQISRLGGPNFHEIPINAPLAPVYNNQRDGMHRQAIHRGRANYEPNSLGGGCPFQAGAQGYTSFPQPIAADKVRGKPELFADHYSQARLFWTSQSPAEQAHIASAFRFELTRVQTPAVRIRVLSMLVNVDPILAEAVAHGLGLEVPPAMPLASDLPMPEYDPSPALSLTFRPGEGGIKTRKVAVLIASGADGAGVKAIYGSLLADGAVPRIVGAQLGKVATSDGHFLDVEISLEAAPSVLYDAVVVEASPDSATKLAKNGQAMDFIRDQYRHGKPIMVVGNGEALFKAAGVMLAPAPPNDPAFSDTTTQTLAQALGIFKLALAGQRAVVRESEAPPIEM